MSHIHAVVICIRDYYRILHFREMAFKVIDRFSCFTERIRGMEKLFWTFLMNNIPYL